MKRTWAAVLLVAALAPGAGPAAAAPALGALHAALRELDATVHWDAAERRLEAWGWGAQLQAWPDHGLVWLNGREVPLAPDLPARILATRPQPLPPALEWSPLRLPFPPAAAAPPGPAPTRVLPDPDSPGGAWVLHEGEIWHTADGDRWAQVPGPCGDAPTELLAPAPGGRLYAAVRERLYRREGSGWRLLLDKGLPPQFEGQVATPMGPGFTGISPHPGRPGEVLVAYAMGKRSLGGGFFRTADSGATWDDVRFPDGIHTLVRHPRAPEILYAQTVWGRLHRSDDGGRAWRHLGDTQYMTQPGLDPSDPGRLYAHHSGAADPGWRLSTDAGQTWRPVERAGRASPARVERLAACGPDGLHVSPDRGRTWFPAPGPPAGPPVLDCAWTRDGTAVWLATANGMHRVTWP